MNQKAKEYLLDQLNDLYARFEGIKIRYEFNEDLYTHIIEILPLKTYEGNQDYVLAEMKIEEEFQSLFEEEEILFVSEDSLNQIKEPSFSLGYDSKDIFTYFFEQINLPEIEDQFKQELPVEDSYIDYALAA